LASFYAGIVAETPNQRNAYRWQLCVTLHSNQTRINTIIISVKFVFCFVSYLFIFMIKWIVKPLNTVSNKCFCSCSSFLLIKKSAKQLKLQKMYISKSKGRITAALEIGDTENVHEICYQKYTSLHPQNSPQYMCSNCLLTFTEVCSYKIQRYIFIADRGIIIFRSKTILVPVTWPTIDIHVMYWT
jgi:hypothetical protein